MTTMNKWGDKCIKNFSVLSETSSKESIQTFVKWIFFNRKQYLHFITAFQSYISTKSSISSTCSILLTVLHEVFILHYGTTDKWNLTSELRIAFGESLVLPYVLQFPKNKLESLMQQWDTYNVFETPTILRQIRSKLLTATTTGTTSVEAQTRSTASAVTEEASVTPKTPAIAVTAAVDDTAKPASSEDGDMIVVSTETGEATVPAAKAADTDMIHATTTTVTRNTDESNVPVVIPEDQSKDTAPPAIPSRKGKPRRKADDDDVIVIEKEKDALDLLIEGKTNRSIPSLPSSTTSTGMTKFNFDAHTDIPMTKVHPNEFIEPCRLIATLQIARDLRNDSAVQISSLLQSLPEPVRRFIAEAAESMEEAATSSTTYELSDSTAREFVNIMNEQLLDMNINEQLENVTTFMELIQRQRKARETIRHLLIASRCQFGADDVAATYYNMNDVYNTLKQRAQILTDAMDLEGFEVQPVNPAIAAMTKLEDELSPFPWYDKNNAAMNENDHSLSKDVAAVESPGEGHQNSDDTSPNKRQKI